MFKIYYGFSEYICHQVREGRGECLKSAQTALPKYHGLGGFNRNLFLAVLEAGKSTIRYQQIQFLVRALVLTWRQPPSCCILNLLRAPFSWPYRNLIASRRLTSRYHHTGVRVSTYEFGMYKHLVRNREVVLHLRYKGNESLFIV